jgi:hypothetical protein
MRKFNPMIFAAAYALLVPGVLGLLANLDHLPMILHRLWNSTTAAWVQAVGALVGIGIAIYLPWNDRKIDREERASSRLQITTSRRADSGLLQVHFRYDPEQKHSGLEIVVSIVSPKSAYLFDGQRVLTYSTAGGRPFMRAEINSIERRSEVSVLLTCGFGDPDDALRAVIFVAGPEGWAIDRAELDVSVRTTADAQQLMARRLWVSPVDAAIAPDADDGQRAL